MVFIFFVLFFSSFVYFAFYFCVFLISCLLLLPMYIVVYFLFVYNFTDHCHRVENQLQFINIISNNLNNITKTPRNSIE
jgi:hypothetical protein